MSSHEFERQVFRNFWEKLSEDGELKWINTNVIYHKYQSTLPNQNILISKVAVGKLLKDMGIPKKLVLNEKKSWSTLYLTEKVF